MIILYINIIYYLVSPIRMLIAITLAAKWSIENDLKVDPFLLEFIIIIYLVAS